jgi:hypothetical protein
MPRGIYNLRYGDSKREIAFIYHYTQPRETFRSQSLLEMNMFTGFGLDLCGKKSLEYTISRQTIEKLLREEVKTFFKLNKEKGSIDLNKRWNIKQ